MISRARGADFHRVFFLIFVSPGFVYFFLWNPEENAQNYEKIGVPSW